MPKKFPFCVKAPAFFVATQSNIKGNGKKMPERAEGRLREGKENVICKSWWRLWDPWLFFVYCVSWVDCRVRCENGWYRLFDGIFGVDNIISGRKQPDVMLQWERKREGGRICQTAKPTWPTQSFNHGSCRNVITVFVKQLAFFLRDVQEKQCVRSTKVDLPLLNTFLKIFW